MLSYKNEKRKKKKPNRTKLGKLTTFRELLCGKGKAQKDYEVANLPWINLFDIKLKHYTAIRSPQVV